MAVSLVVGNAVRRVFPLFEELVAGLDAVVSGPTAPVSFIGFEVETGVGVLDVVLEGVQFRFGDFGIFRAEHFNGREAVGEIVHDELLSVSRGVFLGVVVLLGRVLVGAHPLAIVDLSILNHAAHPELSRPPHGGEGALEIVAVEGVAVVLPEVGGIPRIGHEVVAAPGGHTAEDVGFCEHRPTLVLSAALGSCLPIGRLGVVDDVVEEGQVAVAEVGGLGGPVVHLHIDVGVDVGIPGSVGYVVPDTLEVGGDVDVAATRRDGEVAAVVEVELF